MIFIGFSPRLFAESIEAAMSDGFEDGQWRRSPRREDLTCHEGFILRESRRVPTISFLDEIRIAVGETLGGAGTTGVPGIGRASCAL